MKYLEIQNVYIPGKTLDLQKKNHQTIPSSLREVDTELIFVQVRIEDFGWSMQ